MPIRISDGNGVLHYAVPRIHNGYWRGAVAWVYSGGAWRRTYDPKDENLLVNSRLLNGTDYFTYADGTVIGTTPPGWSAYSNSGSVGGNAYAYYSNTTDEYSRRYTFKATSSRMFFQSRIYVKQGETYNASTFVHSIQSQVGRKSFDIYVDNVSSNKQNEYIEFIKVFPTVPELVANTRVECVFKALKDCLVQFNIGVGVDYNDSGEIQISSPQVTKSNIMLDYQPTPKDVNYNAIILKQSWMDLSVSFAPLLGTNHIESSVIVGDDVNEKVMIIGNSTMTGTSGIGINTVNNTLFVMADNNIIVETPINVPIPHNKVFGAGLWYDVSGGYIKNIRLHANGVLIARITEVQPITGQVNFVFGSKQFPANDVIVEQFGLFVNSKNYTFNIEEGVGSVSSSAGDNAISVSFGGVFGVNHTWLGEFLPKITVNPDSTYDATTGMVLTIPSDATNYDTVLWRNQYGSMGITTKDLVVTVDEDYDYDLVYHAVYTNRFGSVSTTNTKIIKLLGNVFSGESGDVLVTEDDEFISPE